MEEKEIVKTTVDLPHKLHSKICAEAEKEKRSRHSQMLVALEKFFETTPLAKQPNLSMKVRAKICYLSTLGWQGRAIAQKLSVSEGTVSNCIHNDKEKVIIYLTRKVKSKK